MATIILQVAGAALGATLGPFGAAIGSALGALAGGAIDSAAINAIVGPSRHEGPRLTRMPGLGASEGSAVPRVYGAARIGGTLIWATRFEEETSTRRQSGGKGFGRSARVTTYAYFANFAVGLCEGPIAMVRRVWADGRELDLSGIVMRVHTGSETQGPDPLILAKEGAANAPAYRGTAYVVFERLPLADFGNRLPQLAFEVVRPVGGLAGAVRAVNLIPGAGEFVYATAETRRIAGLGRSASANRNQLTHGADIEASLDALAAICPNLESVTLVASWFGDDLRCGLCKIEPRVEQAVQTTTGGVWGVAGLTRAAARVVSQADGRPAYGGTPSDATVLAAIAAIKARGWRVNLHPFVMMDLPADNGLPDPWSGAADQPAYPWRGRVTCDPAPGRPGTPDGTAAVGAQLAALVGTAAPAHFGASGGAVTYTGPAEWSLRRFLLHYAALAQIAGGVDGFLAGSELRSLSTLRGAPNVYPFATALGLVAADVRSMLGGATKITYGADWTEYGAHVPAVGEVGFPLDALWAHPAIDAVGIDWYPPLTDWRDGEAHADAALYDGPNDPDCHAARVAGGEAFDWYYADDAARQAQTRLPIADGAYGKPWLYRPKDLVGWWSNAHVNRVAGVETMTTAWVPQGKPVWLTELGCPAVDRGANGPNVFPDKKSVDGGLPPFSRGFRDDLAQWRLIDATLRHYDPALGAGIAENPVSSVYGGRMLDPARTHLWAWDARPWPAFPLLAEVWSDAGNHETGHWLESRLQGAPLDGLVAAILADFGLPAAASIRLDAMVDGYVIDRPMSARAALEPLAKLHGFEAVATAQGLRFSSRRRRALVALGLDDLAVEGERPLLERRRAQDSELLAEFTLGFTEAEDQYRASAVTARRAGAAGARVAIAETSLVGRRAAMARLAETRLRDAAAGAESAEFALPPARLALEPGDVVTLPVGSHPRDYEILRIVDTELRRIEARALDRAVFDAPPPVFAAPRADPPPVPGAPEVIALALPVARGEPPPLLWLAAFAAPWPRGLVVWRSADGEGFEPLLTMPVAATVGELIDPLPPGPASRWDRAASVRLRLAGHTLASVTDIAALGGANAFAVKAPDGRIEIVAVATAELVGEGEYRLSRLLRGLSGSEPAAAIGAPAGSLVVKLDEALAALADDPAEIGRLWTLRVAPFGLDHADPRAGELALTVGPAALRPFAPVRPRALREAGGIRLTWIRRSRVGGDGFELAEIPLGEASERYEVDIRDGGGAVLRTLTATSPNVLYPAADEIADFGAPVASLSLAVAQVSAIVGRGETLVATVAVG